MALVTQYLLFIFSKTGFVLGAETKEKGLAG